MDRGKRCCDAIWRLLQDQLFDKQSDHESGLFNQYASANLDFDRCEAVEIRRGNLKRCLESFQISPRFMLIGEAKTEVRRGDPEVS